MRSSESQERFEPVAEACGIFRRIDCKNLLPQGARRTAPPV
jgi:hypothetical protein